MRNSTDQEGYVTVRNRRNQNRRNQKIASPPNYWLNLPQDIIIMILQKVGVLDILLSAQLVCTQWRVICTHPSMWATICVVDWFSYWTPQLNLTSDEYRTHVENIIRRVVDESCGSLFDLDLDELMSKGVLFYVVERCNQIRRLRGVPRCSIENVLESVASRLPLLEKFELVDSFYSTLSSEAIETLGWYCPKLTSLKLDAAYGDEEAKAIARSMPQLRNICFPGGNVITDIGVEALLDGCPHLESLEIRNSYFFKMMRGFKMMKNLPLSRTQWRDVLDDPYIWSTICVTRWIIAFRYGIKREDLEVIIQRAADKSCGGLVDLDLDIYMSGDILSYVVKRCTQIRRLHGTALDCSEEAIQAAIARLPLLEDLALVYYRILSVETIETLGRCCPRLTTLEISIDDDVAKILARSLPQLRHLKPLNAYGLTDVGVEALLDGCPHLESLDLYDCYNVRLCDTIGIRCAQNIKHFQRPIALVHFYYCSTCSGSTEYQTYEDDFDYNQFFEEDVYNVDYTLHRREEYWSRREKARGRETRIQQRRRVKGNKNQPNSDTKRNQKARRRDFRTNSRSEVKKEFVYWNKIATDAYKIMI